MTIKLNDHNYLLWVKAFTVFLGIHRKVKHIIDDPPSPKDPTYNDWLATEYMVILLFNSMESNITLKVIFLTSKNI